MRISMFSKVEASSNFFESIEWPSEIDGATIEIDEKDHAETKSSRRREEHWQRCGPKTVREEGALYLKCASYYDKWFSTATFSAVYQGCQICSDVNKTDKMKIHMYIDSGDLRCFGPSMYGKQRF